MTVTKVNMIINNQLPLFVKIEPVVWKTEDYLKEIENIKELLIKNG